MTRVIPAHMSHALALAPRMRQADRDEVMASGGYDPLDALIVSVRRSTESYTVFIGDEVAAMFGVAPIDSVDDVGVVWALTSDLVERHPLAFLRTSRKELARLRKKYSVLVNAIDARYEVAVRWAQWLGFETIEPLPFGVEQRPFVPIRLETPNV